jgi:hypothetical protein
MWSLLIIINCAHNDSNTTGATKVEPALHTLPVYYSVLFRRPLPSCYLTFDHFTVVIRHHLTVSDYSYSVFKLLSLYITTKKSNTIFDISISKHSRSSIIVLPKYNDKNFK